MFSLKSCHFLQSVLPLLLTLWTLSVLWGLKGFKPPHDFLLTASCVWATCCKKYLQWLKTDKSDQDILTISLVSTQVCITAWAKEDHSFSKSSSTNIIITSYLLYIGFPSSSVFISAAGHSMVLTLKYQSINQSSEWQNVQWLSNIYYIYIYIGIYRDDRCS